MPRRKQGHCKASATGGYLKKKSDTGTELIENESLKSFATNNDLVFKIKKTISGSISNSSYHEKIEREHIDASKSLNDIKMVSKHEVNNNLVNLVKEQDENSNNRNVLENLSCCDSNYVTTSERHKSSKKINCESLWSKSLLSVSNDQNSPKCQAIELQKVDSNSAIKKPIFCHNSNSSLPKVMSTSESMSVKIFPNDAISTKSKYQNAETQYISERSTESCSERQASDLSHSHMSGVSPAVNCSDKNGSKSESQQMNYRVSTSVIESRSNLTKDTLIREEQNYHLPSSVYGSPASSVEKVLTSLQVTNRNEENKSSSGRISFLQEILQKKSSESVSYDSVSWQPNISEKDENEEICKLQNGEALSYAKVSSLNIDSILKDKSESSQSIKLKLHIPEVFSNDDSSSSILSSESQKAIKFPKITSPQILEQHISKIISENAAIVETLDPKWSRRYFKQTNLNSSPIVEFDSKKVPFPLKPNRSEDKLLQLNVTEGSKLQSALLGGSETNAINSVQKIIVSPQKSSLSADKITQHSNLSPKSPSANIYPKIVCSVSEDELKGSAIKSLLSFKQGHYSKHQNSVYSEDSNSQHPQNPEGSIIKDLLLKSKFKDEKLINEVDNKLNSNSFILDGNNLFYKMSSLKCPNCSSEFSEKYSLDIHLSFCKSATKMLFSLRDNPEILTYKQINAQKISDFSTNLKNHVSEDSDHNDGPILKKQLLLPLSKSPPMKRRKVSDSVLNAFHNSEQSYGNLNYYDDSSKNSPHTSATILPHRSRSHSMHLFGGEVQIVEGDTMKRIKIKTSVPGAFTPITNRLTENFGIKKLEVNDELRLNQDVNCSSVVVTIAQPGHNSGGTVHVPSCRSPSVSPVVTITSSLSDGILKYAKSERSSFDYLRRNSQTELTQPCIQNELPVLNVTSPSVTFLPGPSNSFSTIVSGLPSSTSKILEFKPGLIVEEISTIGIRVPISPGNKPFYSPIFCPDEKSSESNGSCSKDKENENCHGVPTVIFTPSSPTMPTSDSDVQTINTTSISEPAKKFLTPTRPTSLSLKKPFTMVGSTLISPETPRPKKTCIQLYLNGHAYTYLGLKCSTRSTYCCIYRPQPMFVLQETNPKLSMYSNWQVVPAKEELSGLTPGQMISFYCSKQRKGKSLTATSKLGEPLIFTHSSYWTYRSTEQSGVKKSTTEVDLNKSEDTKMLLENNEDSISEQPTSNDSVLLSSGSKSSDITHHSDESNLRLDTDNTLSDADVNNSDEEDDDECQDDGTESLTDSSQPQPPKRVKIFEGGFKSNEDYTYVRGRGRGKYVCEECGIRCKKPSMLKKHIRTHTDLRPYKCKHCSFAFKTKGNLTKHMKSKAHHKKCTELGIIPVPTTTDDSQIDEEALAKQIEKKKTQFSDGEDADDDDDDESDETDDDCESDASSMIISNSRMLTNGHSKKSNSLDKVNVENVEESRCSESVSQQSEEHEAARSLLHLSAIGEPSQWSTSTGDLTDVASSSEAEIGTLVTRNDPSHLSPQFIPQTIVSTGMDMRSKLVSDQWLSTETFGHRPRSYSADIPLSGGKELLTKYKFVKNLASDETEKVIVDESEFGLRDQYTRRYSISVAREARKPRIIQAPEWNALGLPTANSKWPEDQPMDLSISRDLGKYKTPYGGGTLLSVITQEESVSDRHLQTPLELGLNEQYPMKALPVLSPQVVEYDLPIDNNTGETTLLPLTEDHTTFSTSSTTSRPVCYMQDISSSDNVTRRKEVELSEDPPSPEIDYSVCSPVSPSAMDENSYYYNQESIGPSSSANEDMQSSSRGHAEFIVPTSTSSSMEEGKCVCRICNKIFAKSSHLRLHVNIHYFERPFRCDNCAVSFRTKGHLQKHKRSVSHYNKVNMNLTFGTPTVDNPRPFKCGDCKIAFRIHGHLAKHLRSKMHIMKLECLGKLPFGMYAEMERSGVSLNEIDTTDCNNSLESLQVMAQKLYQRDSRRMRWQGPEQSALETECSVSVPPPVTSTLIEPTLSIPEPISNAYDPSCSGITLSIPPLTSSKHLSNSNDAKTNSQINPIRIPSTYTDGDSAISLSRYATSLPIVTTSPETSRAEISENDSAMSLNRSGTCHLCGKAFKSAKFLQVHLYSDHSNVISSIGDVPTSNDTPISTIASSEMNCDLCGRMFPDQKALQQHLLSHAQPRPFVCEVCDAGFTSSSSLIVHQTTHQTASSQQPPVSETRLVQLK